jgi:hypothetical protein
MNCLLKHAINGKTEGRIEVTGRRGRRSKKLLDDLEEKQGLDCRTGSLHLGPCTRALCAPHWNSFLPSFPEALRTYLRERPLLAREGNWREFSQQLVIHRISWDFWHAPNLGHGTDYFTSPPKEGMLRKFFISEKIQRLRSGSNPRTREPEASMLTTSRGTGNWKRKH